MSNSQREIEILELLKKSPYATVEYLSKKLFISPSSVRRDLTSLENQGYVRRTHGGVTLLTTQSGIAPFSIRLQEERQEKIAIIKNVLKLIENNATLFLDGSTTSLNFSNYLGADKNLTIFTNNLQLAHLLASKHLNVYCIGGLVSDYNNVVTIGSYASSMIDHIYVDTMIFTSSAIAEDGVITDFDENETAIRKQMLSHANLKIFMCPKTRIGLRYQHKLSTIGEMDYVVSDAPLSQNFTNQFPKIKFIPQEQQQ